MERNNIPSLFKKKIELSGINPPQIRLKWDTKGLQYAIKGLKWDVIKEVNYE